MVNPETYEPSGRLKIRWLKRARFESLLNLSAQVTATLFLVTARCLTAIKNMRTQFFECVDLHLR